MKRTYSVIAAAALVAAIGGMLQTLGASAPHVDSNAWRPTGEMSDARTGAAATLLASGRVLVTGGVDAQGAALSSAERYSPSGDAFVATPPMDAARANHTSVLLSSGRVLVAGGAGADGAALATTEIYDPASNAWSAGAPMNVARRGHTATVLPNGAVLIAGGDNAGAASASLELYDPADNTFTYVGGGLSAPRTLHAAAIVRDLSGGGHDTVLIAGGFDGDHALASTDIYDAATGSVTAGPNLSTARSGLSATALLDGKVLVAGGANASGELASAELFDGSVFAPTGNSMAAPRQNHVAVLLPHNNQVLIVGGLDDDAAVARAEIYTPWEGAGGTFCSTPLCASGYQGPDAPSVARSWSAASALSFAASAVYRTGPADGLALVAGGSNQRSAELFGFATIKTDKDDYAPGTTVTITGSGWQPGEPVTLLLREWPELDVHELVDAVADENGNIKSTEFQPDEHDIGVRFYLTAFGGRSQAQTTFDDGVVELSITSPTNAAPVTLSSLPSTVPVAFHYRTNGSGGTISAVASVKSGATVIATNSKAIARANGGAGADESVNVTVPSGTASGSYSVEVTVSNPGGTGNPDTMTASEAGAVIVGGSVATTTTVTSSQNPSRFGQSVTFTARVVPASGSTTPTGSVQFLVDGVNFGAPVAVAACSPSPNACATTATSSLSVATHTVSANFAPGTGFLASSGSLGGGQVVDKSDTTTTITADTPDPSVVGEPVTISYTVAASAPGAGTPAGNVTVSSGADSCTATVALGTCAITFTTAGSHPLTAVYAGDANFNTSTSAAAAHTVDKGSTSSTVISSANPSVFGQSVTFTATVAPVAPAAGSPSGTVTFKDGATTLGTGTLASGQATFATSSLSVASHSITAEYGGDTDFNTSTSGTLTQTVNKGSTTTTVASSANPSVFGQSVTFTATVAPVAPAAGTPSGTVTFKDGATTLGTGTLAGGQATFSTSTLSVDTHSITAVYGSDAHFESSTSGALIQTATKGSTTTTVTSSANPSVFGQSVTFTATVAPVAPAAGTPGGTVTFKDGATTLGTGTLASGQATFSTSTLAVASHSVTAVYGSDASFESSTSSALTQTVNKGSTTTTVISSANPSVFGESVTFTATVAPVVPAVGTPGGTVTFKDGATTLGTGTLAAGQATFSTSTLAVASHSITAEYGGDPNFNTSVSDALTQTVNKGSTTTTVVSSVNPSVFGESVTFTATVAPVAPAAGSPSGTVTFKDGATTLGTGTIASGQATFSTSSLSVASHSITAEYGGDANFETSVSGALTQTVNKGSTTTSVSSSVNPSVFGQSVTFTATVAAVAPAAGTPGGTVTFKDGAATLGTGTLASGQATFTTSALAVGGHSITVEYGGDTNFNASTSTVLTQTVNKGSTTTTVSSSVNPSVFGQSVTFTATVAPVAPAAGTPGGTVTFKDGATTLGTGTLAGGQATLTTSALAVGGHSITVEYGGDTNFNVSTSSVLTQTVNKGSTTTTLASSPNPSTLGQSVTFTATVAVVAPAAGTPSGTVTFKEGATTLGTGTVSGGQATFTTSALTAGPHVITAIYAGDANFNSSTSSTLTQQVNYTFAGFFSPVDNLPMLNTSQAGQAIPIKWRLTDAAGVGISDPSSFGATGTPGLQSFQVGCDGSAPQTAVEEFAPGESGLLYLGGGNWQINWKTLKAYAGQCRTMVVTLRDGTTHTASFKFR